MKEFDKQRPVQEAVSDGVIEGRNAVIEALRAGTAIDKIYLAKGETDKTLGHIASRARDAGVVVVECDRRKLDAMSRTHAHQGVIALAALREYVSVQSLLDGAREKGEQPLLVVCDEISDPHNLGAILRTAECAGAHGVIIPKRRSAGRQDLRRSGELYARGAGGEPPRRAQGAEKAGRLDLRDGGGGHDSALRRGSARPGSHRDRLGGQRHGPPCARDVRFSGKHPDEGAHLVAERLGGGRDPAV